MRCWVLVIYFRDTVACATPNRQLGTVILGGALEIFLHTQTSERSLSGRSRLSISVYLCSPLGSFTVTLGVYLVVSEQNPVGTAPRIQPDRSGRTLVCFWILFADLLITMEWRHRTDRSVSKSGVRWKHCLLRIP